MRLVASLIVVCVMGISWLSLVQPPPGGMAPFLNGQLPEKSPGFSGSWTMANWDIAEGLPGPIRVYDFPSTDDLIVLCKNGQVWRVSETTETQELVLDLTDRVFRGTDAGLLSLAFHPSFDIDSDVGVDYMYAFYRTKPDHLVFQNEGFNRLARFTWSTDQRAFDVDSEYIHIQQYDRHPWHDGGGMFFDNDGYLLLALGDEGADHFQTASTQRLDGGFFSGVIRLDVDNDPSRSHPIRRQPQALGDLLPGWEGDTYSQGYGIPDDNPWLDTNGGVLEEYYALGARSPYSMTYDREKGVIVQGDVGSDKIEEISFVEKGDNLQWPYKEGFVSTERERPADLIGNEKPPFYTYDRTFGSCIVGGGVYKGDIFPELRDHYIFTDFTRSKVAALPIYESDVLDMDPIALINDVWSQPVELPFEAKVAGVSLLQDGRVLVMVLGENSDSPGTILELRRSEFVPDPKSKLSELGIFADMQTLEVTDGILPYTVNSPLWSDGAEKKRWIAVPNDGTFDSEAEQIKFSNEFDWEFPVGTVFIKHFELPVDLSDETKTTRLETRLFVVGEGKIAYGLTYRWNEEGTEAYLLTTGDSREIDVMDAGSTAYTQTWEFPSRDECMTCHNANANFVLGVKTHQLNGDIYYPHLGTVMNQLDFMDQANMFDQELRGNTTYLRSYKITDETADLETKVRSYLDANCASCHREGGLPTVFLDFRYTSDNHVRRYVDFPNSSHASTEGGKIITLGEHETSELWIRDASETENMMPPLGRSILDQPYIDSLALWIDGLEEVDIGHHEVIVYPNPTSGWLGVKVDENWPAPYQIRVHTFSGHRLYESTSEEAFNYINLTGYPAGSYVVTVIAGEKRKSTKFMIR